MTRQLAGFSCRPPLTLDLTSGGPGLACLPVSLLSCSSHSRLGPAGSLCARRAAGDDPRGAPRSSRCAPIETAGSPRISRVRTGRRLLLLRVLFPAEHLAVQVQVVPGGTGAQQAGRIDVGQHPVGAHRASPALHSFPPPSGTVVTFRVLLRRGAILPGGCRMVCRAISSASSEVAAAK